MAVRGTVGLDRLAGVTAGLFAGTGVGVTLYHVAADVESDPSTETLVFGMPADRVAEAFPGPVLVVQREREDDGAA